MMYFKVLCVVSLTLLSLYVRESQSRSLNDDENTSDRRAIIEGLYTKECICFPKNESAVRVSKHLSPNEELERLILYVYRNRRSNKLTVFIPGLNKQRILPELTIDVGDRLESISPEGVTDLFHNDKVYFTGIPKIVDAPSLIPTKEELTIIDNLAEQPPSILQNEKDKIPISNIPVKKSGFTINIGTKKTTVKNLNRNEIHETNEPLTVQQKQHPSNKPIEEQIELENSINYLIPGYVHISPGSNIITIENLPVKYEHPIFNAWFIDQLNNIRSKRPSISKQIDTYSLRLLLTKALYENGIRLSSSGVLHDSYGKIIQLTHLKLQPVLIGDPIDYEKLIATGKCAVPYNIPLLKAVVVSLIHPPKVLAIIPLTKVIVSKTPGYIISQGCGHTMCSTIGVALDRKGESKSVPTENVEENDVAIEQSDPIITSEITSTSGDTEHQQDPREIDTEVYENDMIPSPTPSSRRINNNEIVYVDERNSIENVQKSAEEIEIPQDIAKQAAEDYDLLTYRIVGGNPATSSGTPVSSKGRSGLDN